MFVKLFKSLAPGRAAGGMTKPINIHVLSMKEHTP